MHFNCKPKPFSGNPHAFFLDVQLEWNMKLWWPHCEALIAYLMAYSYSREPMLMDRFKQIYDYTFSHVSDII